MAEATSARQADAAIAWLKKHASKKIRDEMGPRYGVHTTRAFGVSMANLKRLAKQLGQDHALALALWDTGWYEARMLASLVDEPGKLTPAQMDRWCRDFDNWGICDTVCFHLFDRSPHAWSKVEKWSTRRNEFEKRAAFALLASLALHGRSDNGRQLLECLPLIEKAATDERNFVKKGVNWALRAMVKNPVAKPEAIKLAKRLAASDDTCARWVGRDAVRALLR